ncbi:ribonuclease H-like domain-containing protein [Tanacetum coccineum]
MTNIDELLLKLLGHLGLSNTLDAHTGNNNANAIQHSPMSHASSNASPTASRIASPPAYYTSVGPRYYPTIAPQVSPLTYNAPPPGFGYLPATQTGWLLMSAREHTWHQRLGHPGSEVLRRLVSCNLISCNKEKPHVLCHACQLGKQVRLPFVS